MPVGGQAIIEGVLMQNGDRAVIAVRNPQGKIVVEELSPPRKIGRWREIPFIRGPVRLYEMLSLGMRALTRSAEIAYGQTQSRGDLALTVVLAVGLVLGGFVVLPVFLAGRLPLKGTLLFNLIEGLIRIAFFLLYIFGISFLRDVRRLFQYHGAEHKSVHAFEAGKGFSLEAAKRASPLHPRCGTTFILFAAVLTILIFSLIPSRVFWIRVVGRLLLLPVVVSISYEILRLGGKYPNFPLLKPFILPGLLLQRLTTREPDERQLEVAMEALRHAVEGTSAASSSTTA
jgi:uncharacterized protein YqhQ